VSLDKAIKHGKEKRKPYRGAKAIDPLCRTNRCAYCMSDKLHNNRRRAASAREKMDDN
jgi:hypothetical protein